MKMVLYIPVLQSEAETCQSWQLSESHQDHNGQQHSSAPGDREKEPFDFYAVAKMVAQRMTVLRNNCSSTNEIHHDDIGELMILVDFLATLTILACLVIRYSVSWSWIDFLEVILSDWCDIKY